MSEPDEFKSLRIKFSINFLGLLNSGVITQSKLLELAKLTNMPNKILYSGSHEKIANWLDTAITRPPNALIGWINQ